MQRIRVKGRYHYAMIPVGVYMKTEFLVVLLLFATSVAPGCLDRILGDSEELLCEETKFIEEDHYYICHFTLNRDAIISIELIHDDGPLIDLYTVTEINYEKLTECEEFSYFVDLSDPGTRGTSKSGTLSEGGPYYVVVDNTDCGDTQPPSNGVDDSAYISVRITTS